MTNATPLEKPTRYPWKLSKPPPSTAFPPYPFFKFTIIHIGIGNIGNVPLVLIGALCRDPNNPFGDSLKCSTNGTSYISFGQWVGAIILYTYIFNMLAPPPEGTFDIDHERLPLKSSTAKSDSPPEQAPLIAQEEEEEGTWVWI